MDVRRQSSFRIHSLKFTAEEEVVNDLLSRRGNEDLILKCLGQMPVKELVAFTDKEDHKGRTLLVNAIHGNYERVVQLLLVNDFVS